MHVERFGTTEVKNIEFGTCHVFPKIDGTNSSVWLDNETIKAGSRNRELSLDNDNQGFYQYILEQENIKKLLIDHPNIRLYGEWLVPHTLRTYRKETWRRFYVFDVEQDDKFMKYEDYVQLLEQYDIEYIPAIAIINNPTRENLTAKLQGNTFLIQDGSGVGEGIVIKNYNFINRYGRQTWAKIVATEFKDSHVKNMPPKPTQGTSNIEQKIANEFVTSTIVDKAYANIMNETDNEWSSQYINRLLNTVFYDLIKEESWIFLKKHKFPIINFKTLQQHTIQKVKELKPELF
jgi:hypothetical protein